MSEVAKTVGQLMVNNLSMAAIIIIFIISGLFRITKKELDPIGKFTAWVGKKLTEDVKKDVAGLKTDVGNLKTSTEDEFKKIKDDRKDIIDELKKDNNDQIVSLKSNIDAFEARTNHNIDDIAKSTKKNCMELKKRLNELEKSNIKSNDLQTIRQIREHILDFANSCMNKRSHTKSEFEAIIEENAQYEELVKKYKIKNDVYKEDYEFIMKIYHKCQDEGSFLNESKHPDVKT